MIDLFSKWLIYFKNNWFIFKMIDLFKKMIDLFWNMIDVFRK